MDYCKHCLARSLESNAERSSHLRLLAAIIDSAGGQIRISDRSIAASLGPDEPEIEIIEDRENRCMIIRRAHKPASPFPLPFVLRYDGRPTQVLMVPQPAMPKISGNLGDMVTDSMRPQE